MVARHELATDLGAEGHLDHAVVHVAAYARLGPEHDPLAAEDVAVDAAVQYHVWGPDRAFDHPVLAHGKRGRSSGGRTHAAGNAAIQVQSTGELDIALHARAAANQRIDARGAVLLTTLEHEHSTTAPSSRLCIPDEGLPVGCHALAPGSNFQRHTIRLESRR